MLLSAAGRVQKCPSGFLALVPLKGEQPAGAACQGVSQVGVAVLAVSGHGDRAGV